MPSNITSIVQAGVDAFSNLYSVKIYADAQGKNDKEYIPEARIHDFTPPEETVEDYPTSYMMVTINKLKPKLKIDKILKIPIRVSKDYKEYTELLVWKNYFANVQKEGTWQESGPLNTPAPWRGKIVVEAFASDDEASTVQAKWIFEDVICTDVGQPQYTREGSEAVKIDVEFTFTRMREVTVTGDFSKSGKATLTK